VLESKHLTLRRETARGIKESPIAFSKCRPHGNSYIVRIDGVKSRNQAEQLVGSELFVEEDQIDVELPERKLPFQVIGTTVELENRDVVGKVTSVIFSSAHDVYEVAGDEGKFLLPAVPEFIVRHDEDRRVMIVRLMPGLTDQ
jgi:16S rRNA processing protein RimM